MKVRVTNIVAQRSADSIRYQLLLSNGQHRTIMDRECLELLQAGIVRDLTYTVEQCGDLQTWRYTEDRSDGTVTGHWFPLTFPRRVLRALHRLSLLLIEETNEWENSWELHRKYNARDWDKLCEGSGRVVVSVSKSDDDAEPPVLPDDVMERLRRIAQGMTSASWDRCEVRLHWNHVWKEYAFNVGRLHGGIINHGTEEAPDWSLHT